MARRRWGNACRIVHAPRSLSHDGGRSDAACSYARSVWGLPTLETGAAAPSFDGADMMRSILKASGCIAALLALCACANTPPYEGSQGDSPTAAGTSNVWPYDSPSRY
jgi:hypothetical protein